MASTTRLTSLFGRSSNAKFGIQSDTSFDDEDNFDFDQKTAAENASKKKRRIVIIVIIAILVAIVVSGAIATGVVLGTKSKSKESTVEMPIITPEPTTTAPMSVPVARTTAVTSSTPAPITITTAPVASTTAVMSSTPGAEDPRLPQRVGEFYMCANGDLQSAYLISCDNPLTGNASLFLRVNSTEECAEKAKSKGANAFNYLPSVGLCQYQTCQDPARPTSADLMKGTAAYAIAENCILQPPVCNDEIGKKVTLKATNARCLDGSPPGYYWFPGSGDGLKKWVIFHEGGGWCSDAATCESRVFYSLVGSAGTRSDSLCANVFMLSANEDKNPQFHNWNRVFLIYCDGMSFSGTAGPMTLPSGDVIYREGYRILEALQAQLLANGLGNATDVVVAGASAGGLSVLMHLDEWAALLPPQINVTGLIDSAYFFDPNNTSPFQIQPAFEFHQASTVAECVAANQNAAWRCAYPKYLVPYIKTPFIMLQSKFDTFQLPYLARESRNDPTTINAIGDAMEQEMKEVIVSAKSTNALFVDSCSHHTGLWNSLFGADGHSNGEAYGLFYNGLPGDSPERFHTQGKSYPCPECCDMKSLGPQTRDHHWEVNVEQP